MPSTPSGPSTPAAPGGEVPIADGISITPAPGWTVEELAKGAVRLLNSDSSAGMYVDVGRVDSTDINQVLTRDIQQATEITSRSNVKLGIFSEIQPLRSSRFTFQQQLSVNYTAVMSTQQGTMQVYGIFSELLNPSTREAAFIDLFAASADDLRRAADDADTMIASML